MCTDRGFLTTEGSAPSLGFPESGPGLGTVVEAEHTLYNASGVRWNHDWPGASPEGTFGMLVVGKLHSKGGG